ncbi:diguanylate cyclase [Lysinibacillus boronitolerans]|uniref:Membrane protein n=2 Tax=Lysinibacillus boronitolerans TaxID=309788 RepID=A0ABR4XYK2_9BACI|nr:GGDEF domain-containing protein [Lysinibacillus boronitolerans]KGR84184.1 membrane protein [Lysinibacillus boronitolerans JCM 21713 = 10a = NBRC 103108]MCS1393205.1 diguanylate cyclase [Lysinibacillus boronitolerans]
MKNLRIKLLLSLIAFAVILVAVISYVNRQILVTEIEKQVSMNKILIENHILTDMQTVDNAHFYFDNNISDKMEQELRQLKNYYHENPNIATWDLQQMKKKHGMDIYIVDQSNTVVYTTFAKDIGLDFSRCCQRFSALLDERRASGEFFTDGIDISTSTGEYRKFGYLATHDKKYLLELGIDLLNDPVFQTFNFEKTAQYLIGKYIDLVDVQAINAGGVFFNDSRSKRITVQEQSKKFQKYFELAKKTMEPVEYEKVLDNGYIETHRFLPYEAETVRGESSKRIVYVKFINITKMEALQKNSKQFWSLLFIALLTSFIMLLVINKILSKTIQLATFDPLTGVYNRATYIRKIDNLLRKRKINVPGLLLIDLDNFKQVNDQFGHVEGDHILVETARILKRVVKQSGFVVRFGGDEFAIVLYDTTEEKMQHMAEAILTQIRSVKYDDHASEKWSVLSVSMGGAIYNHAEDTEMSLFERADKALYQSKNAGKDQYSSYAEVAADEGYNS